MEMKIPAIAITAVVVITVLAGVLMPVLDDVTAKTDTFTNDGYYRMAQLNSESTYKLFWDHTNPYQVTVNDTDVFTLTGLQNYQAVTLFGSDMFTIRFYNASDNPRVQLYGGSGYGFGSASVTAGTDMTISVSSGSLLVTNTATDSPLSVAADLPEKTYAVMKDGEYTMKRADTDAYVLEDTSIIAICGLTESAGLSAAVYGEGTVAEGLDYTLFRPSVESETAVFSNEVITTSDVSGYEGLVKISRIDFSVTISGGTLNPVYTYFIVPHEVTAERTVHFSDNESAIFAAIPIMVIIALLIAVVAMVFRSREF